MDEDLRPAAAVCIALFAAALVADVALIRAGKAPITAVLRTPAARAIRAYVELHVDRALGPVDLFSHAANAIRR